MAQSINFYSVASLPATASTTQSAGIFFVDGGQLYKGATRFGVPKIFTYGQEIPETGGQQSLILVTYSDLAESRVGKLAKGDIWISQKGKTYICVNPEAQAWTEVGIDIANYVSSASEAGKYVKGIYVDNSTNKIYANAGTFSTDVKAAIGDGTSTSTKNNIAVTVTTTSGAVTAVTVSNPFVATEVTKTSTSNGTTVSVTTKNGQVTGVSVAASDWSIGSDTKTSTSNGITVGVTTTAGVVTSVSVNAAEMANVMHFKGASPSLPQYTASASQKAGDIWLVTASTTSYYITPSGWGSTTATNNTKIKAGQEYIKTPSGGYELIGDQSYHDPTKASTGTSNDTLLGLKGTIELKANAAPTIDLIDSAIIKASTSVVNSSNGNYLVTASAVRAYIDSIDAEKTSTVNGVTVTVSQVNAFVDKVTLTGVGTAAGEDFTNSITSTGTKLPTESAVWGAIGTRVEGGTSTSNHNGVQVTVVTAEVSAKPSVTVSVTPATILSGIGATVTSTLHGLTVKTTQANGVLTGQTVEFDSEFTKGGTSTSWGKGLGVEVTNESYTLKPSVTLHLDSVANTKDKITTTADLLVTASAVANYINADDWAGSSTSTSNSVQVYVSVNTSATNHVIASITGVGTAASKNFTTAAITSTGSSLTTESKVYDYIWGQALVWKAADGTVIN